MGDGHLGKGLANCLYLMKYKSLVGNRCRNQTFTKSCSHGSLKPWLDALSSIPSPVPNKGIAKSLINVVDMFLLMIHFNLVSHMFQTIIT